MPETYRLRITADPASLAKLRGKFGRYFRVEEVETEEQYGMIELLEFDVTAKKFVPVITSTAYITDDPKTVKDAVDLFWIKHRQKFRPDYDPVSEKYAERNPKDPYDR